MPDKLLSILRVFSGRLERGGVLGHSGRLGLGGGFVGDVVGHFRCLDRRLDDISGAAVRAVAFWLLGSTGKTPAPLLCGNRRCLGLPLGRGDD